MIWLFLALYLGSGLFLYYTVDFEGEFIKAILMFTPINILVASLVIIIVGLLSIYRVIIYESYAKWFFRLKRKIKIWRGIIKITPDDPYCEEIADE